MSYQYASRNYYSDERTIFALAYSIHMTDQEAKKILKKLNTLCDRTMKKEGRGVKVLATLWFRGHRGSGCYNYGGRINISHNPSMGLLLHEFAHHVKGMGIFQKLYMNIPNRGTAHHGLHFDICLTRLHDYAKSKGYWQKKDVVKNGEKVKEIPEEMFKSVVPESVPTVKEVLDIAAGV